MPSSAAIAPLIVGVGRVGVAITGLTPNIPPTDAPAAELAALTTLPAPGIAIALRAAVRLGCRARAVGSHGADLLGQLARTAVIEAGIDADGLRASGASACELVTVAADGTLRTRYPGDRGEPIGIEPRAALAGAAAVLIDGSAATEQLAVAEAARVRGLPVILQLSLGDRPLAPGTSELIAVADVLIATERTASELAPRGELADALDELVALGPRAVVITLGAAGAIGRHGDAVVRCPPFPAESLGALGAGSVFHGAFAAALLSELPFGRCVELAAAASALALRELGPWASLPNRADVLALLRARRAA